MLFREHWGAGISLKGGARNDGGRGDLEYFILLFQVCIFFFSLSLGGVTNPSSPEEGRKEIFEVCLCSHVGLKCPLVLIQN